MYSGFVARRLQGFLNSNSSLLCYAVNWRKPPHPLAAPRAVRRIFSAPSLSPAHELLSSRRNAQRRSDIARFRRPSIQRKFGEVHTHSYHRRACCSLGEGASSEAEPQSLPKAQHGGGLRSAGSTPSSCSLLGAIEPTDCRNFLRNCNDDTTVFCSL
jgi:hypothetical protein